jgi:hypothetical protein
MNVGSSPKKLAKTLELNRPRTIDFERIGKKIGCKKVFESF